MLLSKLEIWRSRTPCACGFVMVIELESCLLSCIGRRGFILQNHGSPEIVSSINEALTCDEDYLFISEL